jgi:hypothetical protein
LQQLHEEKIHWFDDQLQRARTIFFNIAIAHSLTVRDKDSLSNLCKDRVARVRTLAMSTVGPSKVFEFLGSESQNLPLTWRKLPRFERVIFKPW